MHLLAGVNLPLVYTFFIFALLDSQSLKPSTADLPLKLTLDFEAHVHLVKDIPVELVPGDIANNHT